jgi:hypothetical protein
MKNILARGGIEFLAVLLGISGSLWIDNYSNDKEILIALNQDISNIKLELLEDLREINRVDSLVTVGINQINIYIKIANKEIPLSSIDSEVFLRTQGLTNTFSTMGSSYLVAQNSGRINKINDLRLLKSISKYYQNSYERLKANNFMYDEFLNSNFFRFKATIDSKKSHEDIFRLFESVNYNVLFLEWRNRRSSYQNYVLNDLKISANQLLIDINNYLSNMQKK